MEEKADVGMSTVTATINKIDDDRVLQKPRKLETVINQSDESELPALGQAQIDEHFERVRMLMRDSEPTNDQISAMRVSSGEPRLSAVGRLCSFRARLGSDWRNCFGTSPTFSKAMWYLHDG